MTRHLLRVILLALLAAPGAGGVCAQETPYQRGVEHFRGRNYRLAAAAFEEGVQAGDAACMDFLGFLHLEGHGRKASPWIAFGYFRQAAELGNDQACRNLGNLYFGGRGVDPDLGQAAHWWEESLKRGTDPRPAFSLGQLYYLGDGVPRDVARARKHWERARKLGSEDAKVALAVLDGAEAVDGLKALAGKGHVTARGALKFFELEKAGVKTLVKEVAFVHQAHNFCGIASTTMLLRHGGAKTSQFEVAKFRARHKWGEGAHWDELTPVAARLGQQWRIDSFPYTDAGFVAAKKAVVTQLEAGAPVIIDILEGDILGSAHSIVLCGFDPKTGDFLARNPALSFPGFQVFPEERLKELWRSIGFISKNSKLLRPVMALDRS